VNKIDRFAGSNKILSNFYSCIITYNGLSFLNSEAAYQAQKTLDTKERKKFCGMKPTDAMNYGRSVKLRDDWFDTREQIMYEVNLAKYQQNSKALRFLLDTEGIVLEEGNYWHDNFYGNCTCDRCKNIKGQNVLGKILMRIRNELQENIE